MENFFHLNLARARAKNSLLKVIVQCEKINKIYSENQNFLVIFSFFLWKTKTLNSYNRTSETEKKYLPYV